MQYLADHTVDLWLSVAMAIGWVLISKHLPKFFGFRVPKTSAEWQHEFLRAVRDVLDADFHAVDAKIRLAQYIDHIPEDFDPTVWLTLRLSEGMHRAILHELEKREAVQPGTLRRIYGDDAYDGFTKTHSIAQPPAAFEPDPFPTGENDADNHLRPELPEDVHWIGDRLLPRSTVRSRSAR